MFHLPEILINKTYWLKKTIGICVIVLNVKEILQKRWGTISIHLFSVAGTALSSDSFNCTITPWGKDYSRTFGTQRSSKMSSHHAFNAYNIIWILII